MRDAQRGLAEPGDALVEQLEVRVVRSAHDGALVMLAFGIGTLPHLLGASYLVRRSKRVFAAPSSRVLAGVVIATFAVYGIYRAVFAPSVLGQSPYCLFG